MYHTESIIFLVWTKVQLPLLGSGLAVALQGNTRQEPQIELLESDGTNFPSSGLIQAPCPRSVRESSNLWLNFLKASLGVGWALNIQIHGDFNKRFMARIHWSILNFYTAQFLWLPLYVIFITCHSVVDWKHKWAPQKQIMFQRKINVMNTLKYNEVRYVQNLSQVPSILC
jgi:hypothetical protein